MYVLYSTNVWNLYQNLIAEVNELSSKFVTFCCIANPWLWQFLFIVLGKKCIIINSISLGCISRSGLFEISIQIKGKHLWKAMKVPDDCQWAGTVNWLIKCFLCSEVMGDNQRNVRRSRNFNQFVSFNCNQRSGH